MAKPILMPQVGQDLEEGKLIEWRVKVGDTVAKGDIVAVVESEKASFEVEAFEAGTVLDLLYGEGDTTKVLAPLMFVGDPAGASKSAETKPEVAAAPAAPAAPATPAAASPDVGVSKPAPVDGAAIAESAVAPAAPAGLGDASPTGRDAGKPGRSSPLARRLAGTNGIDVSSLAGTGPRGAVVKRDIDKAVQGRGAVAPSAEAKAPAPPIAPAAAPSSPARSAAATSGTLHRAWLRKGEGDPVVMIHGFGGDLNAWRVLAAGAALARPILAIDLPGHGLSQGSADTVAEMASAVAQTLADEGVTAADLVGHSLGAAVAVAVAEAARFTVRSLFLLAPAGLGPDINGDFVSGFCRARSETSLAPWMALLVADPATMGPAFVRVTAETRAKPGVAEAQEAIARSVFADGTQAFSIRKTLETLAMPIRVVFGGADRIIPSRHATGLPGTIAQHVFPGIGHMPQIEAREPVARLLVEHLRAAG